MLNVSRCAFGIDSNSFANPDNKMLGSGRNIFEGFIQNDSFSTGALFKPDVQFFVYSKVYWAILIAEVRSEIPIPSIPTQPHFYS